MMWRVMVLVLALGSPNDAPRSGLESQHAEVFHRLKSLVGEWQGTFEWSGARSGKGTITATYFITGNGSAVVENLSQGSVPTMTTVYHLDGRNLRMTHYCGAGNQPRLRATEISEDKKVVRFAFLDATNLSQPDRGHVHELELRFLNDSQIQLIFTFVGEGSRSYERIQLSRTGSSQN